MADTYQKRYDCSMFMMGEKPPKPAPIKPGDTVNIRVDGFKYEGVVMYMTGNDCHIMWTFIKKHFNINRDGMSVEEQKKIFGWPEINPTERTVKTKYPRIKLNNQKSCSNNKSECKMTYKMIINDLNYRYPKTTY